jgi:hypothetical protein
MQFRTSSSTPPHLDRRLQRRMLGYVGLIAFVMLFFQLYSTPRTPAVSKSGQPLSFEQVDYNVRPEVEPQLKDGEFLSPNYVNPADDRSARAAEDRTQPRGVDIDPEWLTTVQDNTFGVRSSEAETFFYVLEQARQVPKATLAAAVEPGLQYLNLMTDPTLYRGKPITIVGEMWRLHEFPANPNDHGLETLYEAWIFTADSGTHPYRVVCSQLGPELKVGASQRTPVRVTGYFFKREWYDTAGGGHVAPTVLAGELERYISENAIPSSDKIAPVMLGIIVGIGLILGVTLISFTWNDRTSPRRFRRIHPLTAEEAAALASVDARSVRDQLRDLELREREAEWTARQTVPPPIPPQRPASDWRDDPFDTPTPPPPTRRRPDPRDESS